MRPMRSTKGREKRRGGGGTGLGGGCWEEAGREAGFHVRQMACRQSLVKRSNETGVAGHGRTKLLIRDIIIPPHVCQNFVKISSLFLTTKVVFHQQMFFILIIIIILKRQHESEGGGGMV